MTGKNEQARRDLVNMVDARLETLHEELDALERHVLAARAQGIDTEEAEMSLLAFSHDFEHLEDNDA